MDSSMIINEEKRTIQAEQGMVLTNGQTYSVLVHLSLLDSFENWRELTIEQASNDEINLGGFIL